MYRPVLRHLGRLLPGAVYGALILAWLAFGAFLAYAQWRDPRLRLPDTIANYLLAVLVIITLTGIGAFFFAAARVREDEPTSEGSTPKDDSATGQVVRPAIVVMPDQRTVTLHTVPPPGWPQPAPSPTAPRAVGRVAAAVVDLAEAEAPAGGLTIVRDAVDPDAPAILAAYAEGWHDRDRLAKSEPGVDPTDGGAVD